MPLIVTGSIGIDSIQAPTGSVQDVLGGSSIYFAAAASFFGPVRLVGAVGDDFPNHHMDTFNHFKIDLAGLEHRTGSKTFRWTGKYHQDMNTRDTIDVQLNVLAEALPPVPEHYRDSRHIFLANTHPAQQLELLQQFPNRALAVADTMDLWIDTQKQTLLNLLQQIDGLVLNDAEATQLTSQTNLIKAAKAILDLGPKFVVIKKGEHGALLAHKKDQPQDEQIVILPAFPTSLVVDPTGAGDSFAGGMMGHLAATADYSINSLRRAIAYGTIAASFNIQAFSLDQLKTTQRSHIDDRYDHYRAMLDIGANI